MNDIQVLACDRGNGIFFTPHRNLILVIVLFWPNYPGGWLPREREMYETIRDLMMAGF